MKTVLLLFALFVFVVVALLAAANATWSSRTAEAVAHMDAGAYPGRDTVFAAAMLDSLPPPVARYLRAVLRDSIPLARHAVLKQEGTFKADTGTADPWPFTGLEHFGANPAGFVWDVRMRVFPGVPVLVRDASVDGEASMLARVAGLFPMVDARERAELDEGALQRWLAETAWFPTALLPGQSVRWTALDDSTARAWVSAGRATVSLDFHFGADSLVTYVSTEARPRGIAGTFVPTPWRGEWSDWRWYEGVRIPMRGEVSWWRPNGPLTYWRGTITEAVYE